MASARALSIGRMQAAWARIQPRFQAYQLVVPGAPSFICKANECEAHCCRVFSVALGEREVDRMVRASGRQPVDFLESEDGKPIELPLLQPYLLARREGRCALLGADLLCGEYEGRPDACRLYPHFVLFVEEEGDRPIHGELDAMEAAVVFALDGGGPSRLVPLLLRHLECPGFTGPPVIEADWRALLTDTFRLQYRPGGA